MPIQKGGSNFSPCCCSARDVIRSSGGTDTHLFLLSLVDRDTTGKAAQLALDHAHHRSGQNLRTRPDNRTAVPESKIPDGPLAKAPMPVDEGRIIETLRYGLAQVMGFRALTDMLYARVVSLMLDAAQPKRPPRTIRRRSGTDQQTRLGTAACGGEFALR